jgi:hypothetical protein
MSVFDEVEKSVNVFDMADYEPPVPSDDYFTPRFNQVTDPSDLDVLNAFMYPRTPKTPKITQKEGLLTRLGKGIWNSAIAQPLQALKTKSSIGQASALANSLAWERADFKSRLRSGQPVTSGEIDWYLGVNDDLAKEIKAKQKDNSIVIKERTKEEALTKINKSLHVGKQKVIEDANISFNVRQAETITEKAIDVVSGIAGFTAQIAALRKAFPGMHESVIWEVQSEINGGKPGEGALTYALFSAPSKLTRNFKPKTKLGNVGKTLATTGGESATLAGLTAASGGTLEDIAISAGIPLGMKVIGNVKQKVRSQKPRLRVKAEVGKTTDPVKSASQQLVDWVSKAKVIEKTDVAQARKRFRAEQSRRFDAAYTKARSQGKSAFAARKIATKAMAGKADFPVIEPPKLTSEQWEQYELKARKVYADKPLTHANVGQALTRIRRGQIPQLHHFTLLEPILGKASTQELYHAYSKHRNFTPWEIPGIAAQVFKSFVSSDIQFVRQGSGFALRHPIRYLKGSGVAAKAYVNKQYADRVMNEVKASPNHKTAIDRGLNFIDTSPYSAHRAEWYSFGLSEKLAAAGTKGGVFSKILFAPARAYGKLLQRAEHSFAASTNSFMQGLWDSHTLALDRMNLPAPKRVQYEESYAKAINTFMKILRTKNATGRKIKDAANLVLFSPSVTAARPLQVVAPFRPGLKGARRYSAELTASNIGKIVGISAIVSSAANMYSMKDPTDDPPLNSSTNPLSSDFGKIKVGDTRYDFTGGDAIFYRTLARLAVGAYLRGKREITGDIQTKVGGERVRSVGETLEQYTLSRQAPSITFAKAVITGKDFVGDDISLPESFLRAITPEQLQAMYDAWEQDGTLQALVAASSAQFSAGVQSYEINPASQRYKVKDRIAVDKHGKAWEDLSILQQELLTIENQKTFDLLDEGVAAYRKKKPYKYNTMTKEQGIAGSLVKAKLPAETNSLLEGVDLQPSRIHDGFYLNDKRFNTYLDYLTEELSLLNDYPFLKELDAEERQEFLQEEIDRAKDLAWTRLEVGLL